MNLPKLLGTDYYITKQKEGPINKPDLLFYINNLEFVLHKSS